MSSFEIKYWKIRKHGSLENVRRFHQISVRKICFHQFSPIFFRTKRPHPTNNILPSLPPPLQAHFRPGRRFADLSSPLPRRKRGKRIPRTPWIWESWRGERLKFISARMLGGLEFERFHFGNERFFFFDTFLQENFVRIGGMRGEGIIIISPRRRCIEKSGLDKWSDKIEFVLENMWPFIVQEIAYEESWWNEDRGNGIASNRICVENIFPSNSCNHPLLNF